MKGSIYKYDSEELYNETVKRLEDFGVELIEIAKLVQVLQGEYIENLSLERCLESVESVIRKREAIHAILTGLALDDLANEGKLPEPIQSIIYDDEGLYGVDEILTLGIINMYGTIGLTNFGYLDKKKIGIIKDLDEKKKEERVTTFADDLVAAIAAAASARIAHQNRK
ncbi:MULTISPECIES: phosphatidylglycerophosphatase A [Peptoniphilus]|uniref:phosphatidylglycerophosphatase A family protein n=1 Tax=Peptoniphilus TaxID=162289 RepID=UPI000289D5F0|nr:MULTISPECIES: phosphatidylglycerophosphatase A [Peptoniphilus]MDU1044209.1 phosphatidylglycerophosphatase A [Peptoniphilus rhinitidis]MDU1955231.1 phosphatidylglycerophosphatase A [Peptoniphilus lacydonensis]MDU2109583.1 phosphatidylglycerophosphatase A [Peptoniphilus lacydonensis]MDU2116084.1 phosphatidylglycerophosphatase A [Peptoniphilus lacydonensis]MDU3751423.1 phosphatidylglycerophosphatase A [Peptoniphilus rhinitidis]